jgi:hypothetical protein
MVAFIPFLKVQAGPAMALGNQGPAHVFEESLEEDTRGTNEGPAPTT